MKFSEICPNAQQRWGSSNFALAFPLGWGKPIQNPNGVELGAQPNAVGPNAVGALGHFHKIQDIFYFIAHYYSCIAS